MNKQHDIDYEIGDNCLIFTGNSVSKAKVVSVNKKEDCIKITNEDLLEEEWVLMSKCKRLPRPGEEIEVQKISNSNWEKAIFIKMFTNTIVWVIDKEKETGMASGVFRLIDKRKEKIDNIIKLIENNDKSIMREMAEIILTAREKCES